MKTLHLMPLIGAVLIGLGVTALSQLETLMDGLGVFMIAATITLSLVGGIWLFVTASFEEADQ